MHRLPNIRSLMSVKILGRGVGGGGVGGGGVGGGGEGEGGFCSGALFSFTKLN